MYRIRRLKWDGSEDSPIICHTEESASFEALYFDNYRLNDKGEYFTPYFDIDNGNQGSVYKQVSVESVADSGEIVHLTLNQCPKE